MLFRSQYNGFIYDITIGTYNGAADTFDNRTINIANIVDTCNQFIYDMQFMQLSFEDVEALSCDELAFELSCYGSVFIIDECVYINTDC